MACPPGSARRAAVPAQLGASVPRRRVSGRDSSCRGPAALPSASVRGPAQRRCLSRSPQAHGRFVPHKRGPDRRVSSGREADLAPHTRCGTSSRSRRRGTREPRPLRAVLLTVARAAGPPAMAPEEPNCGTWRPEPGVRELQILSSPQNYSFCFLLFSKCSQCM